MLADPQFLAHSADTLTDLLSIPLVPGGWVGGWGVGDCTALLSRKRRTGLFFKCSCSMGMHWAGRAPAPPSSLQSLKTAAGLNLRPFRKLLSVMGLLRAEDAELAPILRRMPRGLESLCLSAEGAEEARGFDAGKLHLLKAC